PGVATAAQPVGCVRPPLHVGLVLIGDPNGATVEARPAGRREVEDELVAVVDEPVTVDWVVVPDRDVPGPLGSRARSVAVDAYRLDPMNRVLKLKVAPRDLGDLQGDPRIGRLSSDVEEQGAVAGHDPGSRSQPGVGPIEVFGPGQVIVIAPVLDPQ